MKKSAILLAVVAAVLVMAANLPLAWGYFSTYTEAKGGVPLLPWENETEIREEMYDWQKHVVISNAEDSGPVYVRAKAFGGDEYGLTYETGDSWTLGDDGFCYYNAILQPGEETPELLVTIHNLPEDPEKDQQFNVVVVYESTPVSYDEAGNPFANWDERLRAEEGGAA